MKDDWPKVCFTGYCRGMGMNRGTYPWHMHRCAELVLVPRGHCRTRFSNGANLDCPTGTLIITPPELNHSQQDTPECDTLYFGFEQGTIDFDTSLRTLDCAGDMELFRYLHTLHRRFLNGNPENETGALVATILFYVQNKETEQNRIRFLHPALKAAHTFLGSNYHRKVSLAEIACHSGISVPRLNVLFREQFHCSIGEYQTELRMNFARALLCNPIFSIAEVAEKAGFSSANYFIRCFHQHYGHTPGEFRKPQKITVVTGHP